MAQLENYLGLIFSSRGFFFFFFSFFPFPFDCADWTKIYIYTCVRIDKVQSEGNSLFAQRQSWKRLLALDSDCELCQYLKGFRSRQES